MEILDRDIQNAQILVQKNVKGAQKYLDVLLKYKAKLCTKSTDSLDKNSTTKAKGPWKELSADAKPIADAHAHYETMKNEALLQMEIKYLQK